MHPGIHTVHSDERSPQGKVDKLRPLPPAILLSLALHTCSLISFSSLRPPLSHSHFVSYIFIDALPAAANPFAAHSLTLVRLSNILPYQSSTVGLWFSHYSSSSASPPLGGFTKQTASSKWNLNLNSDLWAFLPREIFHQERQLYTLADAHTQGRETPSSIHVNTHEWACSHTQMASRNFHLVDFLSTLFSFSAKHRLCASCALQLWTLFVPDPNRRMKATEDPSTFWFVLQGKIIIAPLGGPARSPEGPDRTRNVPRKPIKQQLFPVRHIKVWGITGERNRDRKRKLS